MPVWDGFVGNVNQRERTGKLGKVSIGAVQSRPPPTPPKRGRDDGEMKKNKIRLEGDDMRKEGRKGNEQPNPVWERDEEKKKKKKGGIPSHFFARFPAS